MLRAAQLDRAESMPKRRHNPLAESQGEIFRNQLTQLVAKAGGIKALADKCGVVQGNLHHYLKGKGEPGRSVLVALSQGMNVSLDWLLLGEEQPVVPDSGGASSALAGFHVLHQILRKPTRTSDGRASFDVVTGDAVAVGRTWAETHLGVNAEDLFYMVATDADMEPLIRVGEVMIIDKAHALLEDGIYILRMGEQITVKYLQFIGSEMAEVRAESKDYTKWTIKNPRMNTEVSIFGKVVCWLRRR